jgi:hypothetical protein
VKETELYSPIKNWLLHNGYEVQAEVKNCDIVAVKDDALIVIELKTSANMTLLIQATDRQRISDSVYIAIPRPGNRRSKQWRGIQRVLRQLELGMITVDPSSTKPVQVEFDPLPYQKKKVTRRQRAVIREVADRSASYNVAGSSQQKLMTAYRESAIRIATHLKANGPMSPKALRERGTGDKTTSILARNHYGWFQRIDRGIYQITDQGVHALTEYQDVVDALAE